MLYLFLVSGATFLWAVTNLIDKYLIDEYCEDSNPGALVLFSALAGLPVVILISIFSSEIFSISFHDISVLIFSGIIYIIGTVFYLYALEDENTSVVIAQGSLIPIWGLLLGMFFLNEFITVSQFFMSVIIILSAIGLNLVSTNLRKIKWSNTSFIRMLIASFFFASADVSYKFVSVDIDFWSSILWVHIGFILTAFIFFFIPSYRRSFYEMIFKNTSQIFALNLLSEGLTLGGNLLFHLALLSGVVAIIQVLSEGMQPFYVILLTFVFSRITKGKIKFAKNSNFEAELVLMSIIFISMILLNIS